MRWGMWSASRGRRSARRQKLLFTVGLCATIAGWTWTTPRAYTIPPTFGPGDKYKTDVDGLLGKGAYGSVYLCEEAGGTKRAVKIIPMWTSQQDKFREAKKAVMDQEIDLQRHIQDHPNIVKLVDHIEIEGEENWPRWKMIVTELAAGGELGDYMEKAGGKLDEPKAKHIFKQVVAAVSHMHEKRVMHRDLKLDNVLIDSSATTDPSKPVAKLIDFGAGLWVKEGPILGGNCIGTTDTMAPEVILSRNDDFDAKDPAQVGDLHTKEFKKRPFGIRKYLAGRDHKGAKVIEVIPECRYPGDPLGQAFLCGVENGWILKSVNGQDVTDMDFDDILDLMGDRLLDNSSRGAFDGSYKVTGDNKGKGKVLPKVEQVELPVKVEYAELKPNPYGLSCDVWSLGAVLYNMVEGQLPFPQGEREKTEELIVAGTYRPMATASPQLQDLIGKMLVVDPEKRISLAEVVAHPWMA